MSAKVPPELEGHRAEWKPALKKLQKSITKSPALRKSDAPVSALQLTLFSLSTAITALPSPDASGKMIKAGVKFAVGLAKFAVTSDPRAVMQGVAGLAGEAFEEAKRKYAEFYAKQLAYLILRSYQADILTVEEVGSSVKLPSFSPAHIYISPFQISDVWMQMNNSKFPIRWELLAALR